MLGTKIINHINIVNLPAYAGDDFQYMVPYLITGNYDCNLGLYIISFLILPGQFPPLWGGTRVQGPALGLMPI